MVSKRIRTNTAPAAVAALASALLLVACGDGGGNGTANAVATDAVAATQSPNVGQQEAPAAAPLKLDGIVQPESAAQRSVSPVEKRRQAALQAAPEPARIALGALDAQKSAAATTTSGGAYRVGAARAIEPTATVARTQSLLRWQPNAAGGQVAALSFGASGAKGLRIGMLIERLPGSSVLRFYAAPDPATVFRISGQQVLQTIERNLAAGDSGDAARTWWSPDLGHDEVTLEIELPPGVAPASVEFSVPMLSHIFVDLSLPAQTDREQPKDIGDAGACNFNAACASDYASTSDAVARMTIVSNGEAFTCTGTLLNNLLRDFTPYFISAQHCVPSQSAASTLQTDWFFRAPTCSSRTLSSARTTRYGGAQLLYSGSLTDTAFMLLNDAPPANAGFAGWNASAPPRTGAAVVGLHHAGADLLKASVGNVYGFSNCTSLSASGSFSCSTGSTASAFLRVLWAGGVTEYGSSGSGLFTREGTSNYLIGTLRGGSASCRSPDSPDYYGRFDLAFDAALKNWLNPPLTGRGPAGRVPVYRFYNAGTGAHFYTLSAAERDQVIANNRDFAYEGVAFYAYGGPAAGQSAVYRFYNAQTRAHFYTINAAERDQVLRTLPAFQYEGTSWFAQLGSGNGATPLHRFYKPARGTHFYTINGTERNIVIDLYKDLRYEGIAYYGWTGGN